MAYRVVDDNLCSEESESRFRSGIDLNVGVGFGVSVFSNRFHADPQHLYGEVH